MRKGILTASRLINARLTADKSVRWVPLMVTLTYRPEINWEPKHISEFLNVVQMYAKRKGKKLPYAWVMELQKSGKPHYHCIIWIPRSWRLPRADARGWWPHGMTNTIRARNPYGYLSKYASKANTAGAFPLGARIHGIGGLTIKEAAIVAWWKLPKALRLGDEGSHKWRRQVGGGWLCVDGDALGRVYHSTFGLCAIDAINKRVRLVEKPKTHHDNPPSNLVTSWREWVRREGVLSNLRGMQSLEKYRQSLVWHGADEGYQHPTDAPNYVILLLETRLSTIHAGMLPF